MLLWHGSAHQKLLSGTGRCPLERAEGPLPAHPNTKSQSQPSPDPSVAARHLPVPGRILGQCPAATFFASSRLRVRTKWDRSGEDARALRAIVLMIQQVSWPLFELGWDRVIATLQAFAPVSHVQHNPLRPETLRRHLAIEVVINSVEFLLRYALQTMKLTQHSCLEYGFRR